MKITMKIRKTIGLLFVFAVFGVAASAQSVFITQIDPSQLLINQKNHLYAHLLDAQGNPIQQPDTDKLAVFESSNGSDFQPTRDLRLTVDSNKTQGISFLF